MATEKKLKVGLIGFGLRGLLHASFVNIHPRADLTAVCDMNEQLLVIMKHFYPNIPFFIDLDDMLGQVELDTMFICSPDESHLGLAENLVQRNLNVFVETPLADSYAASKKMIALIAGKTSVYSLGYSFPFKVIFQRARALLADGIVDTVKRFRASLYWTMTRSSQSFKRITRDKISSLFYLICWLFGPVQSLYATPSRGFAGVESGVSLMLDFSSGLIGLVDVSWNRPGYPFPSVRISVEGTGGTLEISDDCLKLYLFKKKGSLEEGWTTIDVSDIASPAGFFLCEQGCYEGNSSYIKSCIEMARPAVSWEDGLDAMRLIDAVQLSMHSKREILLKEVT
jgi:myo-inositol 2-dehydrogenase/D-chiro-inositol 1-dehydrogenase